MTYKKCLGLMAIFVIAAQSITIGYLFYKATSLEKFSTIIYDYSNNSDPVMFDPRTQWHVAMKITLDLEHALSHADWLEGDYPYGRYYYRGLAYEMAAGGRPVTGGKGRYHKALEYFQTYLALRPDGFLVNRTNHAKARCFFFLNDHNQSRHYYAQYIVAEYNRIETGGGDEISKMRDFKRLIAGIISPPYCHNVTNRSTSDIYLGLNAPFLIPSEFVKFMKSGNTDSRIDRELHEESVKALSYIFDILGCTCFITSNAETQ